MTWLGRSLPPFGEYCCGGSVLEEVGMATGFSLLPLDEQLRFALDLT